MDLRGQDHKRIVLPSSFVYNPPNREPNSKVSTASIFSTSGGGGDRRRDGTTGNGTSLFSPSLAFDHHHHPQHHHLHQQHNQQQQSHSQPQPLPLPQPQPLPQQPAPPPPQSRIPDPEPEHEPEPDPEPDPVPVSIANSAVVTSAPIASGSTPRTPTTRTEFPSIRYRECLKNHAASIGGHVVDGCGEFMPGGEEGTPEALKCAACECHRNFHRKEGDGEPQSGANYYYCYNPNTKANGSRSRVIPPSLPAPHIPQPIQQHQKFPIGLPSSPPSGLMPPMMMTFGGGGGSAATDSSSEELNVFHSNAGPGQASQAPQYGSLSKKRFRTKFSKEQKDKMMEFADKVGWRMQKQDEQAVQQFCAEVGVKRQVLKVWMHNNKHSMKKKDL